MASKDIRIRLAAPDDAAAILAVYAPYIRETPITFETEVPRIEDFRERIRDISALYPYLVLEEDGALWGFAYAHRSGERAAYDWDAELSVYLDGACTGRGWGRALAGAVLELLAMQGVRNVFSLIALPNEASVGLHESLGFRHMGTQRRAGYKLGAWHDVEWMQKEIGDFEGRPAPLTPVRELDPQAVAAVLAAAERSCRGA